MGMLHDLDSVPNRVDFVADTSILHTSGVTVRSRIWYNKVEIHPTYSTGTHTNVLYELPFASLVSPADPGACCSPTFPALLGYIPYCCTEFPTRISPGGQAPPISRFGQAALRDMR